MTKNVLTQRMKYPGCAGEITIDATGINNGDYAGICVLQADLGSFTMQPKKPVVVQDFPGSVM